MFKLYISTFPFSRNSALPLQKLQESGISYKINDLNRKLTKEELATLAIDCDAIIAGTENLEELIKMSNKLKLISRIGIGLDSVPIAECIKKNIQVTYTPSAVTSAVVELTLGLILGLSRKIIFADREVREGKWNRLEGPSVGELCVGIIGCGRIGSMLVEKLIALGVKKIFIFDIENKKKLVDKYRSVVKQVELDELLKNSDLITIHTPKTRLTKNLISEKEILKMKDGVMLVNTARGGIINEEDLYTHLKTKKIASAALDVFETEPYVGNLASLTNIIMTQHMGSCSYEARKNMELEAVEEVIRFSRKEELKEKVDLLKQLEN